MEEHCPIPSCCLFFLLFLILCFSSIGCSGSFPLTHSLTHTHTDTWPHKTTTGTSVLQTGSLSQAKIRNEADLNPTEGSLVLFEYSEERPPIQLSKGMASKIVNYYRGDRARCPVSAGGGDRPTRRKRADNQKVTKTIVSTGKIERPPRLAGPNEAIESTLEDWIGKPPKKKREEQAEQAIDILPEGVTEILHPKVHGPFIGEVEDGQTQSGLITNMFTAPIFRHEPESSDFLMILGRRAISPSKQRSGIFDRMSVVLKPLPASVFTVGQVEPRERGIVHAPQTTGERNFLSNYVSFQIAKSLQFCERHEGRGLRFDEITNMFRNSGIQSNGLRQRIKSVAKYDKVRLLGFR